MKEVTTMDNERYDKAVDYICNTPLFTSKSGFDNIRPLLDLIGNPENKLQFIHVAGTNGKGSVSTMLASIYKQAGYIVGVFTSPHLIKINERIKVDGWDITDQGFLVVYEFLMEKIHKHIKAGGKHPTFFEILFLMALVHFERCDVDFVILEAGIGGELDTTNIIPNKIISVITSIGFDHTALLGDTIESIAKEKAGIISENGIAVIHTNDISAIETIETIAKERHATVYYGHIFDYTILKRVSSGIAFSINSKYYKYDELFLNSYAHYQIHNVATVLLVVELLQNLYPIIRKDIIVGIKEFSWPGRMELVYDWLLLEGAHNREGLSYFIETINQYYSDKKITIVFSMVQGKDYIGVIDLITQLNNINKIIIYNGIERSIDCQLLKGEINRKHILCEVCSDLEILLEEGKKNRSSTLTCFIGSLYLVGTVKKFLLGGLYD